MPTKRVDPDQDDASAAPHRFADLRATSDKMARSILAIDRIFAHGTPYVVVYSPKNETRFQFNGSMFVQNIITTSARMRPVACSSSIARNFELIQKERSSSAAAPSASRPTPTASEPRRRRSGPTTSSPARCRRSASRTGRRSRLHQATFALTDAETGDRLAGPYNWKKVGESGVLYR
jgi:hypothetical protein